MGSGTERHFNPLSLYRERRGGEEAGRPGLYFNPLSLYRERQEDWCFEICFWYFNPLSLYRERPLRIGSGWEPPIFQSTLPIQGETLLPNHNTLTKSFQSTLPIQGETSYTFVIIIITQVFQSTLPIQGETSRPVSPGPYRCYFNPLSLYRERLVCRIRIIPDGRISIHSPYTGRDHIAPVIHAVVFISIHSPYTGRDEWRRRDSWKRNGFQSTLPIQGETPRTSGIYLSLIFQSTLPIQGETVLLMSSFELDAFQSTLPIQGETEAQKVSQPTQKNFNPLSLYRERRKARWRPCDRNYFNPLSLYRERPILTKK